MKNKEDKQNVIESKLDVIIALLAILIGDFKDVNLKANKEIVNHLSNFGMTTTELAKLFRTSESSVSHMKKKKVK